MENNRNALNSQTTRQEPITKNQEAVQIPSGPCSFVIGNWDVVGGEEGNSKKLEDLSKGQIVELITKLSKLRKIKYKRNKENYIYLFKSN